MLIVTALLLTLGCLTAFNIELKKEYLTGNYKSKFKDMVFTPLQGIEELDIHDANTMVINVEQGGKEGIWLANTKKENFQFTTDGHTLKLGLSANGKKSAYRYSRIDMIIVTRQLTKVGSHTDVQRKYPNYGQNNLTISGYTSDMLDVILSASVGMEMKKMTLNNLTALVGEQVHGNANLEIAGDTHIKSASFNVPGASKLTLTNAKITKTIYQLSDSATVTLNGKLMNMVK